MATLDHTWDGDLQERNNPLPRWWLILFVGSIIWGFGYLMWYPGLGAFSGVGGWSQISQYEQERERIDAVYQKKFASLAGLDYEQLINNQEGMNIGARLFGSNCATCHGADGRGATGFPNLSDNDWLYGNSASTIEQTIVNGRNGVMPPWQNVLSESDITAVIEYVKSLSGLKHASSLAKNGETHFQTLCVACHGPNGEGVQAVGGPDLSDHIWLYGQTKEALIKSVAEGRNGVMPTHKHLLSEHEIKLLTAYVLSLGRSVDSDTGR